MSTTPNGKRPIDPTSEVLAILQDLRDTEAARLEEFARVGELLASESQRRREVYRHQAQHVREIDAILEMARSIANASPT